MFVININKKIENQIKNLKSFAKDNGLVVDKGRKRVSYFDLDVNQICDIIIGSAKYSNEVEEFSKNLSLEIALSDNQAWIQENPDKEEELMELIKLKYNWYIYLYEIIDKIYEIK